MAAVGRRKRRRVSGTAAVGRRRSTRRRVSGTAAVGRRRSTRRRVSGTAAVGRTRRRRRVGSISSGSLAQIGTMAIGIAGGAIATHMLLRPLEQHVTNRFPMAGKMMGAAEVLLGGFVALKAKNAIIRGVGFGIMGGGVHTMMHQFGVGAHSPAISGPNDYGVTHIPLNGSVQHLLSGVLEGRDTMTETSYVAGTGAGVGDMDERRSNAMYASYLVAGTEEENFLSPMGYDY